MEQPGAVIVSELREIQHKFGYLPAEELRALSARLRVPVYQLHAVASFFPTSAPPARTGRGAGCADMSCHLKRPAAPRPFNTEPDCPGWTCRRSRLGRCDRRAPPSGHSSSRCRSTRCRTSSVGGRQARARPGRRPADLLRVIRTRAVPREAVQQFVTNPDVEKVPHAGRRRAPGHGRRGFRPPTSGAYVRQASGDVSTSSATLTRAAGTIKDRFIMESVPHLPSRA
jgi:hypothetical protein